MNSYIPVLILLINLLVAGVAMRFQGRALVLEGPKAKKEQLGRQILKFSKWIIYLAVIGFIVAAIMMAISLIITS